MPKTDESILPFRATASSEPHEREAEFAATAEWEGTRIALILRIALAALCLIAPSAVAAPPSAPRSMPLTLPEAVFLALRNNRGIHSQYLQRVVDKFALRVAEDIYTPKLTVGDDILQTRNAGASSSSLALSPTGTLTTVTGANFSFGFANAQTRADGSAPNGSSNISISFDQPLLAGGGLDVGTAPLRQARIAEQNAQLTLRNNIAAIVSSVILAYRQLVLAEQQARIAETALKRARDLREVNRLLIDAGRLARVELAQSDEAIAQAELHVTSSRNSNNSARLTLLTLLSLDLSTDVRPTEKLAAPSVSIDLKRAIAIAFANQPGYLQQALQQETARINLMLAKNQRLWNVSLVGGSGLQNRGSGIPDSASGLVSRRPDYQIGLQFSVPVNDLTRQQAEVNATIGLRQIELAREQAAATLEQQVTDAVASLAAQTTELEQARRARALSAVKLEIELTRLRAGRSSNFQVVSFQNDVQQAENAELSATISYLNALTAMDQLLGTTLKTWKIELNDQ